MVSECVSFIQACKAAKVKHIVKCTQGAIDADSAHYDLAEWNRQIEESLKCSGISYHNFASSSSHLTFLLFFLHPLIHNRYCIIRHAHSFATLRIFTEQYVKFYRY